MIDASDLARCSKPLLRELEANGKRLWDARHERAAARLDAEFDALERRLAAERQARPRRPGRRQRLSPLAR